MDFFDRRAFLRGSTAAALGLAAPPDLFTASTASAQPSWDAGIVFERAPPWPIEKRRIERALRGRDVGVAFMTCRS